MDVLAAAAQVALAAVLLVAASAKAGSLPSFAATVRALGVPLPGPAAVSVVVAEAVAATGLLGWPGAAWPRLLTGLLALAFAAAGASALARRRTIACACFGGGGQGRLGRRQLLALPVWLAALALSTRVTGWSVTAGLAGLAAVALAAASLRAAAIVPTWRVLRADRIAVGELRH
jgi:hypothetical protein